MTWEGHLEINDYGSDVFVIVPAREEKNVDEKIEELENFDFSYVIVGNEKIDHPDVVYRSSARAIRPCFRRTDILLPKVQRYARESE